MKVKVLYMSFDKFILAVELKIIHTAVLVCRAVRRSENPGVPVVIRWA